MRTISKTLLLGSVLAGCAAWSGCGDSASNDKPVMVQPDVPPAESGKDSMAAYLKDHPKAAKTAGKDAPKK